MGVQGNKAGLSMQESCSEMSNIFYAAKKNCFMRILSSRCSDLTLINQTLSFTRTTLKNAHKLQAMTLLYVLLSRDNV